MKIKLLLIALVLPIVCLAQKKEIDRVMLINGKSIIVFNDKTWEYTSGTNPQTPAPSRAVSKKSPSKTNTYKPVTTKKSSQSPSYSGYCGARTKSGGSCRRRVSGGGYCYQHR